jgi:tetratricopeptide (TPR) repeat protein
MLVGLYLALGVSVQAQPNQAPRLSSEWKRIQSANFTVVGNAGDGPLRSTIRELESFRHALVTTFPGLDAPSSVPALFVLFKHADAFRPFAPLDRRGRPSEGVVGYFSSAPDARYMVAFNGDTRRVTLHEFTHALIHQSGVRVPTWVDEGLAEFYGSFRATESGGVVGDVQRERLAFIVNEPFLSFEEMFTPEGVARTLQDDVKVYRFYSQSWLLVHYSMIGDRRGQLTAYLQAVNRGLAPAAAFAAAYKTSFSNLLVELRKYAQRRILQQVTLTLPAKATSEIGTVEAMTEAEALQTQAALLVRTGAIDQAERLVAQAFAAEPAHPAVRVTAALIEAARNRRGDAITELRQVVGDAPQFFPARYWLASVLSDEGRDADAARAWLDATDLNPRSAYAWAELSATLAALKLSDQAAAALERATMLERDVKWLSLRVYRLFSRNDSQVVADATTYIRERSVGGEGATYIAFLGALAARRLGQPKDAEVMLSPLADVLNANAWPLSVAEFLRGRLTAEALLKRAKDVGENTEAHAYIGLSAAVAGRVDEARTHLEWVRDNGSHAYTEYELALRELTRLDAAKSAATFPSQ